MNGAILPGSTIGVLGSGQLGRMFAMAARKFGYRVHVLSPDFDSPAGQIADREIVARYDDRTAIETFARTVDVVTLEFENVPVETCHWIVPFCPLRPGPHVLQVTQHRLREKQFLRNAGLPVGPFLPLCSESDLQGTAASVSFAAVLKTVAGGYDGKGQVLLKSGSELRKAWNSLGSRECILEDFVDFECELSVIAVRGLRGEVACYDPIVNHHRDHILDVSISPGSLPPAVASEAQAIARAVVESLDVVGVLCVEFFLTRQGKLLINELAPRPHNSGHLTIDAHETSQFEQQVRAVCGLPLGSTRQHHAAAMANVLGDCWTGGAPHWLDALAMPGVHLNLYGKQRAIAGRKMGHLTALADSPSAARELVLNARAALQCKSPQPNKEPALA